VNTLPATFEPAMVGVSAAIIERNCRQGRRFQRTDYLAQGQIIARRSNAGVRPQRSQPGPRCPQRATLTLTVAVREEFKIISVRA